jgi:hypothetical protein
VIDITYDPGTQFYGAMNRGVRRVRVQISNGWIAPILELNPGQSGTFAMLKNMYGSSNANYM